MDTSEMFIQFFQEKQSFCISCSAIWFTCETLQKYFLARASKIIPLLQCHVNSNELLRSQDYISNL